MRYDQLVMHIALLLTVVVVFIFTYITASYYDHPFIAELLIVLIGIAGLSIVVLDWIQAGVRFEKEMIVKMRRRIKRG